MFIIFWFKNFRLFGGLRADIRRKLKFYISDFKDCLHVQCIASVFFMCFACLTPIITFGGLLGAATDNNMVRPLILLEILRQNLLKFLVSVFLFNLNVVQRIYKTTRKETNIVNINVYATQLFLQAAIESLLAGAICGISYHLFAGQPLTILGSTGPVLVFETIVYNFCR